jgi:phage tail P2-like protein
MVKTKELLSPNLQGDKNLEGLCAAADKIFSIENELNKLLVYIIDDVPAEALPYLAWQFHVEGYDLAQTDEEKRSLIKKSFELHRYKGTPWAVKQAIKSVGYTDAEIIEGLPTVKYDGAYTYSGSEDYMGGVRWALFRVILDIGESKSLTKTDIEGLVALVNEYKNARSHLRDIVFKCTVEDHFDALIDSLSSLISIAYEDIKPWGIRYDGSIQHNQAERRCYDGRLRHNSHALYNEWLAHGKLYDNEWDIMSAIDIGSVASDEVKASPLYDGRFQYSGFTYGSDAPFAVDAAMPLSITKHIRHDSRYNYGGIYYNGAFKHDSSKSYFGGIYYSGNIKTQEALI